jgi:hypothetical protein
MNKLLITLTLSLSACGMFDKKPDAPIDLPVVRNCKQQPLDEALPKDPAIPCKRGDWYSPGDKTCSSTEAKCLAKRG